LGVIPPDVFREGVVEILTFEDYRSPGNLARMERLQKTNAGWRFVQRNDLPRYCWRLNSKGVIESNDLYEHVSWLVGNLRSGFILKNLSLMDFEYGLSAYWGSGGTGDGPLITTKLSKLLVRHGLKLDIGFYLEVEENP